MLNHTKHVFIVLNSRMLLSNIIYLDIVINKIILPD